VLEVQEVLHVLLRVTSVDLLQHGFVESKCRELTGTEYIRRCYDRRDDFGLWLIRLFLLSLHLTRHDV
jgi:hypothetical protein